MIKESPYDYAKLKRRKALYKGFTAQSEYIPMRDGVKIAADVLLPEGIPSSKKLPAVLIQTRYWRAISLKKPFSWLVKFATNPIYAKKMTKYGFAVVEIDVRGTGASYGVRPYPFSKAEVEDGMEVIDWIIKQPWSNGNVVTWGNSYTGITSELSASLNHPAIKCHIAKHNPWDLYRHAMFPGGCFNQAFIKYWSTLGKGLDTTVGKALEAFLPVEPLMGKIGPKVVIGVKPVNENNEELKEIAKIHLDNKHPFDYGEKVTFRDDPTDEDGTTIDDISIYTKQKKIEKDNIPLATYGSWQDSGTADFVISRFMTYKNPIKAIIGDWDHNGFKKANPYFSHKIKVAPKREDQIKAYIKFYEDCISGNVPEKALYYYTMGEETWKKTQTWPPKGQSMQPWYLNSKHRLTEDKPIEDNGRDEYLVNYTTTTGIRNRWYTLLSLPIFYPNREKEDEKCLTYTSAPLETDMEITGHPVVHLFLSSTNEDGMIHAHLEYLDEEDNIHWITDGQFRFIHRKVSEEKPPYEIFVPYHTYLRKDGLPLVPGEIAEISFGMQPTSILIKKGYKLRVVLAGADKDTFARYPAESTPKLTIERNKIKASYIELPVISK